MKALSFVYQNRGKIEAVLMLLLLLAGIPAATAQTVPTPTPDADGVIWVVVQPEEGLWIIAARAGISLDELLSLNNLTESSVIQPGDRLIIGVVTPTPTVTAQPPTPTSPPTPTVAATAVSTQDTGICLTAFDDSDADGQHGPGERLKVAVAFTLFNSDAVVANYVTSGSEPYCLYDLAPGEFEVTRSRTANERLTTPGQQSILLRPGTIVNLAFGSTTNADVPIALDATAVLPDVDSDALENTAVGQPGQRWLLITIGLLLLLFGTLFFIIRRLRHT